MEKLLRRSFRGKSQEPELDFRPTSRKQSVATEALSSEKLAQAELNRWSQGGGGAVVGNVEWVPDPVTGGQRAVFRPVSSKVLENALSKGESEEGADTAGKRNIDRKGRAGRPDPTANMTTEEKAEYAKRVIEDAIEAERAALEKALAPKNKNGQ